MKTSVLLWKLLIIAIPVFSGFQFTASKSVQPSREEWTSMFSGKDFGDGTAKIRPYEDGDINRDTFRIEL